MSTLEHTSHMINAMHDTCWVPVAGSTFKQIAGETVYNRVLQELKGKGLDETDLNESLYVAPEITCGICDRHFPGDMASFIKSLVVFFASKDFAVHLEAGLCRDISSPVVPMQIPKVSARLRIVGRD